MPNQPCDVTDSQTPADISTSRGKSGITLLIFCAVGGAFFLWRMSFDMIWDDTPVVICAEFDRAAKPSSAQAPDTVARHWRDAFSAVGNCGYRPLTVAVSRTATMFFRTGGPPRWIWIAAVSLIVAGFASAFFRVALHFTGSSAWSLFALIIVTASPPYLCAAAVVVAGVQSIVPLILCSSLLLYWSATSEGASPLRRRISYTGLFLVLMFGPWFREFIGLSSVLIGGMEVLKHRRPTRLLALTAVTFLHAVFPTVLIRCVLYPHLPLLPVFQLGHLGREAGSGGQIRTIAIFFLLAIVPSTLWLISALGVPARIVRCGFKRALLERDWIFLQAWFLLSFLPLLKVFTEHVHLLYALVPGSIIVAVLARDLSRVVRDRLPRLRPLIAAAILLTILDHSLNLVATHLSTVRIIEGYRAIAERLKKETRPGDVIVANFVGSEEIRYHVGGRNTCYFTVAAGVADDTRVVDESAELQRLLDSVRPGHDVYFLAAEFDYPPEKSFYHPHKYVRFNAIETELVGVLHETQARYPYLDPVKLLIPRRLMPFPASPDLMNDFYLGSARDGRRFWREVYAQYQLYRVTGRKVDPWQPTHEIRMVESGRKGFNILECNGRFFAIHQSEGPFDIGRACRFEYTHCRFDMSLDRLNAWVDSRVPVVDGRVPTLVAPNHRGYNIIQLGSRFYGIRQDDGAFDLHRYQRGGYRQACDGKDLSAVKRRIDAITTTAASERTRS